MDAIILAGGVATPEDPLYKIAPNGLKSMIHIAGKPMVQWVLDAASGANLVDEVVLIGIEDTSLLSCSKHMHRLSDKGSLIENIQQGAAYLQKIHPNESHLVSMSADIPTITPSIIDDSISEFQKAEVDIYYSVVERSVIEKRFPGSKRTYIKFRDTEICGGDLNAFSKQAALNPAGLWSELIKTRKNPLKQAGLIGWGTLLLVLTGRLTLESAAERVCNRLGITGKAVRTPYAEIGMDVDKPFQLEMVEQDLLG